MPAWLLTLLPKARDLQVGLFVKKPAAPDLSREFGRAEQIPQRVNRQLNRRQRRISGN